METKAQSMFIQERRLPATFADHVVQDGVSTRKTRAARYGAVAVLLAACSGASPALAADVPTGPAAAAARAWFSSDRSLGCLRPDGTDIACGPANEPSYTMLYGNADGGPGTPDAVVVVIYVNDSTGNAQLVAAAAFRQDATGTYRLSKHLTGIQGSALAPRSPAVFGSGRVTLTMVVPRPGDGLCCPTGRKQIALSLR